MNAVTNILVVGIGGQGVMTATEILAEAALALGYDVKKTGVAGMVQRGGVVSSHLRFGPKVLSPQIMPCEADLLVAFEAAEGLRWCHYLKTGGLVLLNTAQIVPPVVDLGLYDYPADPVSEIRARGYQVAFDAMKIALKLGDVRLGNTIMLGAMADHLPFPVEALEEAVLKRFKARKPQMVELNRQAFMAGRAAEKAVQHEGVSA
jgi:indolepyruvate ferredoxin oxidoreductase beta subunit